jgi:hypothetical protein
LYFPSSLFHQGLFCFFLNSPNIKYWVWSWKIHTQTQNLKIMYNEKKFLSLHIRQGKKKVHAS